MPDLASEDPMTAQGRRVLQVYFPPVLPGSKRKSGKWFHNYTHVWWLDIELPVFHASLEKEKERRKRKGFVYFSLWFFSLRGKRTDLLVSPFLLAHSVHSASLLCPKGEISK